MKKFLFVLLLVGVCCMQYLAVGAPVADLNPAEVKYDKVMERYAAGLKAAFAEKDDKKTIAIIHKTNDAMITELEKLKPELERWVKGMTEKEKADFKERESNKAYRKTIYQVMLEHEVVNRVNRNPELQAALEDGQTRTKALGLIRLDADEEDMEDYEEDE